MPPESLKPLDLDLGPIVGHTTASSSRIWIRTDPVSPGQVLRIARSLDHGKYDRERGGFINPQLAASILEVPFPTPTTAFRTSSIELDGLFPGSRYFYEIVPTARAGSNPNKFVFKQPFSFRTLPAGDALEERTEGLTFLALSCNGLHKSPPGVKNTAMWDRLLVRAMTEEPHPDFCLMMGDQIYADHIRDGWLGNNDHDVDMKPKSKAKKQLVESLQADYAATARS